MQRSRRFGDVWLALEIIQKLGLRELLEKLLPDVHPEIPWARLAEILVVARFCEPSSELHIAEEFYQASALGDLLGIPDEEIYSNRLYRALDQLLEHKDRLQQHLKERLGELFAVSYDILLYDVTSTYFEGEEKKNRQAQRGYSPDGRPDCKQVCIGMVVTKEGIPLGYEVFEGNRHDSKTVQTIIDKMEALYGKSDRVWIMDRGMTSEENLELLAEEHRRYITGTPKNQLRRFEKHLIGRGWHEVHEGLEVKLCPSPDGTDETFILCRSAERAKKEEAMHDRFIAHLEDGLQRVKDACAAGRITDERMAERRVGRLLERYSRAAPLFKIKFKEHKHRVTVRWKVLKHLSQWARLSEGCYLLRTNVPDWTPEDLWTAYIQLTDAEAAFRIHKQDLKLRQIWHQREDRVQAHILVCFLTYVLWKCLGQMCKRAELGDEPHKVLEQIKKLNLADIILPTRSGSELRLRCVLKPEKALALLLDHLNLRPPLRLAMQHKM
jgi:transposase